MTNRKNLNIFLIILGAAIIGGIIYWFVQNPGNNISSSYSNSGNSASPAYINALKVYADRRIQFDSNCLLTPNEVTFKVGTTIMLDNRSDKSRNIALDNTVYNFNPYDYKLVTLTTNAPLPHTIMVDCGQGQNNGRILLQR